MAAVAKVQKRLEAGEVFRLTPMNGLHLTLYFCGDLTAEEMQSIGDRLEALGLPSPELQLTGLLRLPSPDVPKVIAVGIEGGRELAGLQQRVHDVCYSTAAYKENRAFLPHVTVARLKNDVPARAKIVKRTLEEIGTLPGVSWTPQSLGIYENLGGEYSVIRQIRLG